MILGFGLLATFFKKVIESEYIFNHGLLLNPDGAEATSWIKMKIQLKYT